MIADQDRDGFRRGYAVAMAWANTLTLTPDGIESVDDATAELGSDGQWHITADSVPGADEVLDMTDADAFMEAADAQLHYVTDRFGADWDQHGHDFALTRNGHGAGFWDRGYGLHGRKLTELARPFGSEEVTL